jgi:type I restriction enzyme S subunit
VVRIANGQIDPKKNQYRDLPHIGPENIESGTGRIHGVKTAKELDLISGKYLFDADAVVYSKIRPNLNKVCRPMFSGLCSADAYPMWPAKGLSPDFLCCYMLSELFVKQSVACSMRTGMPKINREDLNSLWVICPSESEQVAIYKTLSKWDQAIDPTEQLIAEKRLRRKGLIQQLLTGKRRLPGFKKLSDVRQTRYGCYPLDWGYQRIGEVAKHVSTKNQDGTTLPVLSCTKHRGLVDSMEYFGKQIFSKDLSTYKVVHRGQFAYATNHIEEGSIGYQDLHDAAVISPMYTVFEAGKKIDDRFLFLLLKTELYRHIFEVNTSASVDRRGSLRWPDFSRIHIPLPSLEEQRAIVKVIEVADRELDRLKAKADALRQQKKGLMQQLLTGKKRVRV